MTPRTGRDWLLLTEQPSTSIAAADWSFEAIQTVFVGWIACLTARRPKESSLMIVDISSVEPEKSTKSSIQMWGLISTSLAPMLPAAGSRSSSPRELQDGTKSCRTRASKALKRRPL